MNIYSIQNNHYFYSTYHFLLYIIVVFSNEMIVYG
jgi:hypothetical protein